MEIFEKFKILIIKSSLMDDYIFKIFVQSIDNVEEMLEAIFNYPLKIVKLVPQCQLIAPNGKEMIVDCFCELEDGQRVYIEVQKQNNCNHIKRVRLEGALATSHNTNVTYDCENVPNVIVIYLSNFDVSKKGKQKRKALMVYEDDGEALYNGYEELYINTAKPQNDTLGRFIKNFLQLEIYSEFKHLNNFLKQKEEGEIYMTDATKKLFFDLFASEFAQARTEGRNEGRNEGRIEGRNEGRIEGRIEGTREGKLNQIVSFYQKNYITLQQACDEANMTKEEFLKLV